MAAVPELLEQQEEDRSKVRSSLLRYLGLELPLAPLGWQSFLCDSCC